MSGVNAGSGSRSWGATVDFTSELEARLRPGMTVALGDGVGQVRTIDGVQAVCRGLGAVARAVGGVRLVIGWIPEVLHELDPADFADVTVLMPGWGARKLLSRSDTRFLPVSLSAIPALLAGPLRPDILITRLVRRRDELFFGTEISWQREVIDSGARVLAIIDDKAPCASAEGPLDAARVSVVGRVAEGPAILDHREPEPVHMDLASRVVRLIPPGARVQYGPGQLGTAILHQVEQPIGIDTGLLTDAVVELDRRGLLLGKPSATYLIGSPVLYEWSEGRQILRGIDHTHDVGRLARGGAFVSVNTAIEIDHFGQINVEGIGERIVGGIGGHPDFCTAGRVSRAGLSIIAIPSRRGDASPLVAQLSRPVSTVGHDIDVVVTEGGVADLRDLDWHGRRAALEQLFS